MGALKLGMTTDRGSVAQDPNEQRPRLSFIVPVRDDAARLQRCLASINADRPGGAIEIIVADNGSVDASAQVARESGAAVVDVPDLRVSEARNRAATIARADALAFVDADHEIRQGWIAAAIAALQDPGVWAAGDHYRAPPDGTWVQRAYDALRPRTTGAANADWLPSGNLVVRRAVFEQLRGFDIDLETCEDVDFCQRIRQSGGRLLAVDRLWTIHHGDPRTLRALFYGELWRGRDNIRVSLRVPLTARALPSLLMPVVNLISLAAIVVGAIAWPLAGWRVMVVGALVLTASLATHAVSLLWRMRASRAVAASPLEVTAVSVVYDLARSLALIFRAGHKRRRQ